MRYNRCIIHRILQYMSQKSIILIVTLFALIVAGMFLYAHLKQSEMAIAPTPAQPTDTSSTEPVSPYANIERVTATHYFIDGTHTLVGEVNLPTPCDLLVTEAVVMESLPEQVRIDFSVINNADTCAQVVTAQRFMVSVEASEGATFEATFNGRPV